MNLRKLYRSVAPYVLPIMLVACGATAPKTDETLSLEQGLAWESAAESIPAPKYLVAKIKNIYPHDRTAYTQGLLFDQGALYESTGEYGRSSIRKVDLTTGKVLRNQELSHSCFGEGLALEGDQLYQLTWREGKAFVYDKTSFKKKATYQITGEGWGLTFFGGEFFVSDGSSSIKVLSGKDLSLRRTIEVRSDRGEVNLLNELEWIDGRIWANIYTTSLVAVIDPATGHVEQMIDCAALARQIENPEADVLNGIAVDSVGKRIFMTGKNWEKLFEIEL